MIAARGAGQGGGLRGWIGDDCADSGTPALAEIWLASRRSPCMR
jgi:hypothetical protein